MTNKSFMKLSEAFDIMVNSDDDYTVFASNQDALRHISDPCTLRLMWTSNAKSYGSFAFQKSSPYLPFFNHAYRKMRENGEFSRINNLWSKKKLYNCEVKETESISIQIIGSILIFLLFSIAFSLLILVIELIFYNRGNRVNNIISCQ